MGRVTNPAESTGTTDNNNSEFPSRFKEIIPMPGGNKTSLYCKTNITKRKRKKKNFETFNYLNE